MGLLQLIRSQTKTPTIDDPMKFTFQQLVDQAEKLYRPTQPREYTIHVGYRAYVLLNFTLEMSSIKVKYWTYIPERNPKFIYVSLFRKEGLFKMKVFFNPSKNQSKYELLYGTEPMIRSNDLKFLKVLNDIP